MMFYVVFHSYVGPNQDQNIDGDLIVIQTTPGRTNRSREPRTDGWLGTTNDVAVYAHGEYPDLRAANEYIRAVWGDVRDSDVNGESWAIDTDIHGIVETFKPGKYAPMSLEQWADSWQPSEWVAHDTTDVEIRESAEQHIRDMNDMGYTCEIDDLIGSAEDARAEKIKELEAMEKD